jgi:hypothetical protein
LIVLSMSPTRYTTWRSLLLSFFAHANASLLTNEVAAACAASAEARSFAVPLVLLPLSLIGSDCSAAPRSNKWNQPDAMQELCSFFVWLFSVGAEEGTSVSLPAPAAAVERSSDLRGTAAAGVAQATAPRPTAM